MRPPVTARAAHAAKSWGARRAGAVVLLVAIGGACTAAWVAHASVPLVWDQAERFRWLYALPALALTVVNLALRFGRWQFLLRRLGVRLPIRTSAGIFVAGLATLLTPAYAGEAVKVWLVALYSAGAARRTAVAVVTERALDLVALALIAGLSLAAAGDDRAGGALVGGAVVGLITMTGAAAAASRTNRGSAVTGTLVAALLSFVAWSAGTATLWMVLVGLDAHVGALRAAGVYALATLVGAVTLLPAGIGAVGTAMVVRLQGLGVPEAQGVLAAVLTRLLTAWLTAGIGAVGAWRLWLRLRNGELRLRGERERFNALAAGYTDELAAAARERVVARKVTLMGTALAKAGIDTGARVLDAGCGPGWYTAPMAACGYRVSAIDLSESQARLASQAALEPRADGGTLELVTAASILRLPFQDQVFDAAYATNVLHHAGDAATHEAALAELSRVVRPDGLVFIHEINTRNPLFGTYMSYVFPLLKRIDAGTEHWLDPERLPGAQRLTLETVQYYTFLPDFTPAALYGLLEPLERALERSPARGYTAHFTAVYRRLPDALSLLAAQGDGGAVREGLVAAAT